MDLVELAQRSAAITGDFLAASAAGAATQTASAVGSAVAQLVVGRLGVSPAASGSVPALRAAPQDARRRSDVAAALREVLAQDPAFAGALREAVRAVEGDVRVVASGQESYVPVASPVTADRRGVAVGRDQHNNKRVTKKSGALWVAAVAAVGILAGGGTYLITQSSPDSPRQKAEKTALDFVRAQSSGDIEAMCGLLAPEQNDFSACRTQEGMREAKAEAIGAGAPDELRSFAEKWEIASSDLPSDNTARVTTVNKTVINKKSVAPVTVHLT
ncbi:hypothetical protein ACFYN0_20740 [Streptomyces sp. NPDC006704]|uniref:hypothetical protein n=1 Tax=Streptomyces sp. NPDC006704 TaxID=3364760 RepID=UPI003684193E